MIHRHEVAPGSWAGILCLSIKGRLRSAKKKNLTIPQGFWLRVPTSHNTFLQCIPRIRLDFPVCACTLVAIYLFSRRKGVKRHTSCFRTPNAGCRLWQSNPCISALGLTTSARHHRVSVLIKNNRYWLANRWTPATRHQQPCGRCGLRLGRWVRRPRLGKHGLGHAVVMSAAPLWLWFTSPRRVVDQAVFDSCMRLPLWKLPNPSLHRTQNCRFVNSQKIQYFLNIKATQMSLITSQSVIFLSC